MLRIMGAALLAVFLALPAAADVLDDLTDGDRETLHREIRNYLLENPEIMLEVIDLLEQRRESEAAARDLDLVAQNIDALVNDGVSFVGGNPEGDITVVEFIDYQCSFCKRAYPEVHALLEADSGVRLIRKEFPILGPASEEATRAALAVLLNDGPEIYDAFSGRLMRHNGPLNTAVIRRFASEAGADTDSMTTRAQTPEIAEIVARNRALAQALQVSGTPTFVFGDRLVRGYLPLDRMQALVTELRQDS